jgi:hypothetical protein
MTLTQERLKDLLEYDPLTGVFYWRVDRGGKARVGTVAGVTRDGVGNRSAYRYITVDWVKYPAHKIAFLYMTGRWPNELIDHKDMNGLNNTWGNLREATEEQNRANTRARAQNKLGVKGVYARRGGYCAEITRSGRKIFLGDYPTLRLASEAYLAAAQHYSGEFARAS